MLPNILIIFSLLFKSLKSRPTLKTQGKLMLIKIQNSFFFLRSLFGFAQTTKLVCQSCGGCKIRENLAQELKLMLPEGNKFFFIDGFFYFFEREQKSLSRIFSILYFPCFPSFLLISPPPINCLFSL